MSGRMVSVVAPVFNEEETAARFVSRVNETFARLSYDLEIILVDDGSDAPTVTVMERLASEVPNVTVLFLSRNFGHQAAITAGIDYAQGDAVVTMDSDLQHPPETIPELLRLWEAGYDIVFTIRDEDEGVSAFKRVTSRWFYRVINALSETHIPQGAADFRLMTAETIRALRAIPERTRFLRGLASWIGFRQTGIHYKPNRRDGGVTKFGIRKMTRLFIDALTSMSTLPLRIGLFIGSLISGSALLYMFYIIAAYFATDRAIVGWSSLIVAVLLLGGLEIILLGVLGLYIAKIFDEVKGRPIYIVRNLISQQTARSSEGKRNVG